MGLFVFQNVPPLGFLRSEVPPSSPEKVHVSGLNLDIKSPTQPVRMSLHRGAWKELPPPPMELFALDAGDGNSLGGALVPRF